MTVLAIDLGTTACKASVVDVDGIVLGSGIRRISISFGAGGAAEQDAEDVWRATLDACRNALVEAGTGAARAVEAIGLATQWSSIVAADAAGRPVSPLVMWLDRRGDPLTAALSDRLGTADRWRDVNGFLPSTSLGHVLRLQRDAGVHARTAAYLEPMDYLGARFTGRIAATANSAMPLALTDNRVLGAVDWSDELTALAGVDRTRLPEIVRSLSVLGPVLSPVADELGVPRDVEVVTGANDSVASAFGSGAIEPGAGTIMMGTTGVLVVHQHARYVDPSRFIVTMPSALDDRYYLVAEGGLGGKLLELALTEIVGDDGDGPPASAFDSTMALAAASSPGAGGVLFLPWVLGSKSPAPDPRHRGALLGMSMSTSRNDVARALLEGVALQMRWLADEVETVTGVVFDSLRFVGGGAQSDVWAQIMADVVGRTIEQVAEPRHANARGAGLMGFVATGRLDVAELAGRVPIHARYEPDESLRTLYTDRLGVMRDLHSTLAEPVSRLSAPRPPRSTSP